MSDIAISIRDLGRMYKLYDNKRAQLLDLLGFSALTRHATKEFWALRHLNLDIARGERLGLIGRNGAGKSTLLKILCGRSTASEGHMSINGEVQALLGIGTGFNNEFTGRENIYSALSLHGLTPQQIRAYEEEIIDFTELEDFIGQPVKFYSAGMYTRLAFAVATSLKPEILIIDEVLGAGDAAFVTKCAARMKRLTQETGATVLFVSHSTASIIEICNRAALIDRGLVVADGDPLEITKRYHQQIRAEEEISLKAREYKMRRRDLKNLQTIGEKQPMLFRFVCDTMHPSKSHKIRTAMLVNRAGEVVSMLRFGAPHDNSEYLADHVIDAYGLNDWGKAEKDRAGSYRRYQNMQGQFCHAPFQLSVGLHELQAELTFSCDATVAEGDTVHLEWFAGEGYQRLGTLIAGDTSLRVALPERVSLDVPQPEPIPEEASFVDDASIYGSQELRITDVHLRGAQGREQRSFETGGLMQFHMRLQALQPIASFVVVLCIYQRDGRPGTQLFATSEQLGLHNLHGETEIMMQINPLRLGEGEYMVSVACFKEYTLTTARENDAYMVLDRAILFNVSQPYGMAKSIGGFAQPVTWRVADHCYDYDPALAHKA